MGSSNTLFFPCFFFTPPSGRGLVIPIFFQRCFFWGGHLPQTSGFRLAKEILVVSFATQPRAFTLSDRNTFYTPRGGGRTTAGSNAPEAFLVTPPSGRGLVIPVFNRRSRVRAVVTRGSTGLVGQNTSCKAHKVCISLWPTGWDDMRTRADESPF